MNPQPPEDSSPADNVGGPEFTSCRAVAGGTRTIYTYHVEVEPPRYQVEHDGERRVFRVTGPDGTSAAFRDQPVRFLVVQPDPRTGEPTPVMKSGEPAFLYLCREDREAGM